MKKLMYKLIQWYKDNYYSQGDSYDVSYNSGIDLWIIRHNNDHTMQHGSGGQVRLNSEQIDEIINH